MKSQNKSPQTIAGSGFCRKFEVATNQITMTNLHNSSQEVWLPVLGFENKYQVSNLGRVKSMCCNKEMVRKITTTYHGYCCVTLHIGNDKYKNTWVHRLVAEAFIPNPCKKLYVNHKNSIRNDNRVENLEWVTAKENVDHAVKAGSLKFERGERHMNAKITDQDVREIRLKYKPYKYSRYKLGKEYSVSDGVIKAIIRGRTWKHVK